MPALANRVREVSDSVGRVAIVLAGAPPGYVPFSARFADGTPEIAYVLVDKAGGFEIGKGTFRANTLERDVVEDTPDGGTVPVDLAPGGLDVFCDPSAADLARALSHAADRANPHRVTKAQVGLGNVPDVAPLERAANGSDVPDPVTFRRNIGLDQVANAPQLERARALGDLTDLPTARDNLEVYSKADIDRKLAGSSATGLENALVIGPVILF